MHKKTCARPMPSSTVNATANGANVEKDIDATEISEQLQNLVAG